MCSPQVRSGNIWSPSFRMENLHNYLNSFCMENLSLLPNLLIYSIIYLHQYVLTDIYFNTLGYNLKPLYFVAQNILALAIGSSFSWPLCTFDILLQCVCIHIYKYFYVNHLYKYYPEFLLKPPILIHYYIPSLKTSIPTVKNGPYPATIHLLYGSIPAYIYSSIRITNAHLCEKRSSD